MFIQYNPNPNGSYVGDCVVRAISIATGQTWYKTYIDVAMQGLYLCDMPSSNRVWGEYLKSKGYHRYVIPDTCPACYTVEDFCEEHPHGTYILATGTHVLTVINGDYYDSWNSGNEQPIYYWREDK